VRRQLMMVMAITLLAVAGVARAESISPEETVTRYLAAMKAGKFADAYDYVSKDMAQNKNREEWAKEQQWVMQATEAKIFEFKVYPGKIDGESARVPNILSSQDKFLNQLGVEEQELYTLVREDGKWKINQQQIVEKADIPKWFPAVAEPQKPKAP
jgi:hypothetical protein